MICLSIGVEGTVKVNEELSKAQMAEIRLDLTNLNREETVAVFRSKKALVATCRTYILSAQESRKRLLWAILGNRSKKVTGKRYIDLDYDSPEDYRSELINAARRARFQVILSFHNYESTDSIERLSEIYETSVERGADIVKIVTTATNIQDSARILKLYRKYPQNTLLAFALNKEGRSTRIVSKALGSPFIYCSPESSQGTAGGQFSIVEAEKLISKKGYPFLASRKTYIESVMAPASKSHAQRAILSAALAKGKSSLYGYTPCDDSETAISMIRSIGVRVKKEKSKLSKYAITIESPGIDDIAKNLPKQKIYLKTKKTIRIGVGESGLLCRLMIPLSGQLIKKSAEIDSVTITGKGSLLKRTLFSNEKILNDIGLRSETTDEKLPAVIYGETTSAHFKTSGKEGSQLLSGMLMALPLCEKSSHIELTEATSIPYIDLTVKTLQEFGISIDNKDFQEFKIHGKQKYKCKPFLPIEGDWSGASMLLTAGAISNGITITNLPINSKQADEKIIDILKSCGVEIEITEYPKYFVMCGDIPWFFSDEGPKDIIMGSKIVLSKPKNLLIPFEIDATNFPDLFPSLVVLALNCNGTSRIKGISRLANKESNRAESLFAEFTKLGANIDIDNDWMIVEGGELHGGLCSSHNDHRIAMALITASLKIKEKIYVDDLDCISKSFPDFIKNFK